MTGTERTLPERVWVGQDTIGSLVIYWKMPDHRQAVEFMRVLSRQEVDKLVGDGVDVQQYINSLLRTIEGQRKHIARLTAQHGPTCICAACEDKRGRMTL